MLKNSAPLLKIRTFPKGTITEDGCFCKGKKSMCALMVFKFFEKFLAML